MAAAVFLPMIFGSCSKDKSRTDYEGKNRIYLSFLDDKSQLCENDEAFLTGEVTLTNIAKTELSLKIVVLDDMNELVHIEGNPVIIRTGEKKAAFKVISNKKKILTEDKLIRIGIEAVPDGFVLDKEILVTVTPSAQKPVLSEKQLRLIEGYKARYGIDLMDFIGIVRGHTKVESKASEISETFAKPFTREYDGITVITLSNLASEEEPVLCMTSNPLGLNEYMGWVLLMETVFNDQYWHQEFSGPNYKEIEELLGWNKQNPGVFTMSLDNIKLENIKDKVAGIKCIGTKITGGGDETETIPFKYHFTPWEKQKTMIAEGNKKAKELEEQDGTANPDHYLMTYSVTKDDIDDKDFFPPDGKIDFNKKIMTFNFCLSHTLADKYTQVYTTYDKNK